MDPRLLTRRAAAEYLSTSLRRFDYLVAVGDLPRPIMKGKWDRIAIDRAIDRMSGICSAAEPTGEELFKQWEATSGIRY